MEKEILTPSPLPDGSGAKPADGSGAVSASDVKTALEKTLGKTFTDEAAALKAVSDTFAAVGRGMTQAKVLDAVAAAKGITPAQAESYIMDNILKPEPVGVKPADPVDPNKFVSRDEFDREQFYAKNPQYDTPEARDVISTFQSKTGKSVAEVVELPTVKTFFEKAAKADEVDKSKSVLHSNPRMAVAQDKMTQAQNARSSGDMRAAAGLAVGAVVDMLPDSK